MLVIYLSYSFNYIHYSGISNFLLWRKEHSIGSILLKDKESHIGLLQIIKYSDFRWKKMTISLFIMSVISMSLL